MSEPAVYSEGYEPAEAPSRTARLVRDVVGSRIVVLLAGAGIVWGINTFGGRQDQLCRIVRSTVIQGDKRLQTAGAAGNSYFKTHPKELADAHRQNKKLIDATRYCA